MSLETKKTEFLKTISKIEKNLKTITTVSQDIAKLHNTNLTDWKEKLNNLNSGIPNLQDILVDIEKKLRKYEKSVSRSSKQILANKFYAENNTLLNIENFRYPDIKTTEPKALNAQSTEINPTQTEASNAQPSSSSTNYILSTLSYLNPFSWFNSTQSAVQEQKTDNSAPKDTQTSTPENGWQNIQPETRGLRLWTGQEAKREEERKKWTEKEAKRDKKRINQQEQVR